MDPNPCSVPDWLRAILPMETEAEKQACRWHDAAYDLGGDHTDRLRVDLMFARLLLKAGMIPDTVEQYFWGVRQYGGPSWRGGDGPGAPPLVPPPPDSVNAP